MRIVIELLVDDDKCGPLRVAAVNLLMSRLYTRGRQYSGARIGEILQDAGLARKKAMATHVRTMGNHLSTTDRLSTV